MNVKRVLIAAPLMPEFDRESGSQRVYDTIMFLRDAGWAVSFVAENGRGGDRYARLLQQRGVPVYNGFGERFERLLTRGKLDAVIFAFWHLAEAQMQLVRRLAPRARILVDTIDLHFLRDARRLFQSARMGASAAGIDLDGALDAGYGSKMVRELNTYAAADGVLTVSQKEAELIADLTDEPKLTHVVPDCEDLPISDVAPDERCGISFIGNFRHPPNVSALEFLCQKIVPRVAPGILKRHPLYVVGNALDEKIRNIVPDQEGLRMVGWVPSVLPYLERTRISVVPLLYGAGTKRKILQALMVGTPTISTSAGIEGLGLRHEEHVLVADDPDEFASSIERLVSDAALWDRLSRQGREHVLAGHSRELVRQRLLDAIDLVLAKSAKRNAPDPVEIPDLMGPSQYRHLVKEVKEAIAETVPEGAMIAITTRGDPELLNVSGRRAWHFPQNESGAYAGYYPRDSAEAIEHVEHLRKKGAGFLVFPHTSVWWLQSYPELKLHLQQYYREALRRDGTCIIFDLRAKAAELFTANESLQHSDGEANLHAAIN
jgi:glycosyltransferase involved in cell wall biosynthesis